MKQLIDRFKDYRKKKYIVNKGSKAYAFIGMGSHSINNLYPIINYFRLHLKYIVTKSASNAKLIDEHFPHSVGTNDLDKVLADKEIAGVFISANPSAHYKLVQKVLSADKNVFVEKPPCMNAEELEKLINTEKSSKGQCLVGLQKRYAPITMYLKKHIGGVSYTYRFVTGSYPEGDAVLELFIHPLSLVTFIFGTVDLVNVVQQKTKTAMTTFLHLVHENKTIGSLELSTDYSWTNATEKLIINTKQNIYETTNFEYLSCIPKAGSVFNIPKEKIFNTLSKQIHLEKRNSFNPTLPNNQLYSSGYFSEIKNFIQICEQEKGTNNSTLASCKEVYQLIATIKHQEYV